jgi:hypothetical protein
VTANNHTEIAEIRRILGQLLEKTPDFPSDVAYGLVAGVERTAIRRWRLMKYFPTLLSVVKIALARGWRIMFVPQDTDLTQLGQALERIQQLEARIRHLEQFATPEYGRMKAADAAHVLKVRGWLCIPPQP